MTQFTLFVCVCVVGFRKKPSGVGFSFSCLTAGERGSARVRPEVYHVCSMPCKRHWPGKLPARTGPVSSAEPHTEFAAYRASAAKNVTGLKRDELCRVYRIPQVVGFQVCSVPCKRRWRGNGRTPAELPGQP